MIHAAASHFLWSFAVRYAAHQLNLWPRVSLPETSPTLRWTGEVGNASVFQVWGSRAFVCNTSTDKLFARAIPCTFLGFPPDAPGWQFYHPTSRRVFPSQDVTFDESVPFCRLFFYRSAPPPPPPLFLAPGPPPVDPLPGTMPVEVAVDSGAAQGVAFGGAEPRGAEPGGAGSEGAGSGGAEPGGAEPASAEPAGVEPGGAELEGVEPRGAESKGAKSGGAEPRGIASSGGPAGASSRLSPRPEPLSSQQLREWFAQRTRLRCGVAGAGDSAAGGIGAGGAGVTARAGGTGGVAAAGPGGARTRGTGAARLGSVGGAGAGGAGAGDTGAVGAGAGGTGDGGAGAGGAGARDTGAIDPGAGGVGAGGAMSGGTGAGGTVRPRLFFVPLLCQPGSPLPAPSPYAEQTDLLTEPREPESHPTSPIRAARTSHQVPRPCPPPVTGTHTMALRPSSVPLRVPLPPPPESSLPAVPNPESNLARAASPTVSHFLATVVTDPSFESSTTSALVAEMTAMDAKMASWKSTRTYFDAVPPSAANIVDGMWIFRVKRPPGSPPAFKARYVARGFSQRQGVDYFQTFSPTPKMTTLRVLLHVAAQRDYELHSLDFSTAFLQGSLHEEIWLRRPLGFTGSFPAALGFTPSTADLSLFLRTDTSLPLFYILVYVDDLVFVTAKTEALTLVKSELQKRHTCTDLGELRSYLGLHITRDRARRTITLTQSHLVHHVLQRFGFQFSSPQPTPLSTSHLLSAPPSDESVEPSGPYPELVGYLLYLMTCTRPDLAYPLSLLACYVTPGRHRKVHWDAAKRVLRYLCSTSGMGLVLGGWGPVVLTDHADASWVDDSATQRSSQGYTFSLGSGSLSWQSTRSSSVLSSSCEAEIYAGAMAAQELRWLTYLLTDLGEQPCSPPVPYVNNKAMIALYQEHRLEHRTKHIALRYFLARELQQRGQQGNSVW
ncbi:unnamed protein product [Closterium sp. NIES-54]